MPSTGKQKRRNGPPDPNVVPLPERSDNQNAWCVYVLRCRNNYLYIGITNDLKKRLTAHDSGKGSKFVKSHRPFQLMKIIFCIDGREARKLEYSLKKLKRRDKFSALGMEYCDVLKKCAQ